MKKMPRKRMCRFCGYLQLPGRRSLVCTVCGTPMPKDGAWCMECGAHASAKEVCPSCGKDFEEDPEYKKANE